ncbi:hypothetical protein FA13DRAFT_1095142 [Coprinellus micaceus]|uniref:Uncharacterized protein n=1 Tax=Coprinellus micaceus TaxID=71717 RepID=A0A4Y7SX17_COPMI|nr:hypothetical protein FA13DRAFT_1095142 [Coprinellus micaceus]
MFQVLPKLAIANTSLRARPLPSDCAPLPLTTDALTHSRPRHPALDASRTRTAAPSRRQIDVPSPDMGVSRPRDLALTLPSRAIAHPSALPRRPSPLQTRVDGPHCPTPPSTSRPHAAFPSLALRHAPPPCPPSPSTCAPPAIETFQWRRPFGLLQCGNAPHTSESLLLCRRVRPVKGMDRR